MQEFKTPGRTPKKNEPQEEELKLPEIEEEPEIEAEEVQEAIVEEFEEEPENKIQFTNPKADVGFLKPQPPTEKPKGSEEESKRVTQDRFAQLQEQYKKKLEEPKKVSLNEVTLQDEKGKAHPPLRKPNMPHRSELPKMESPRPAASREDSIYGKKMAEMPPKGDTHDIKTEEREPKEDDTRDTPALESEEEKLRTELAALKERLGESMPFRVVLSISGEELQNMIFDQDIVTIGRDANCDIVVDNLGTSRVHAIIERLGKLYFLRDQQSKTGTFVKGKRIEEYTLNTGDEFFLAKHTLVFHKLDASARGSITQKKAKSNPLAIKHMARTMAVDLRPMAQKQEVAPAYLHVADTTRRIPFNKTALFFGKSSDCDVTIGGLLVGDRHAVLIHEKKGFILYHINYFRPPLVNSKKVETAKLGDGDTFEIGDTKFIFAIAGGKPEDDDDADHIA